MSNSIIWLHQSTVDYTYRVQEPGRLCANILDHFVGENSFKSSSFSQLTERLHNIQREGLLADNRFNIRNESKDEKAVVNDLSRLRDFLDKQIKDPNNKSSQIGGNPAISALRGHFLRVGGGGPRTNLPLSFFAGLVPASVRDQLNHQNLEDQKFPGFRRRHADAAFKVPVEIMSFPQTISIEGTDHKLMLVYGPGRALGELQTVTDHFRGFVNRIVDALQTPAPERVVVAVTTPYDTDELSCLLELLELLRRELTDRLVIFVGTNAFTQEHAKSLDQQLLSQADIISMNRDEAKKLYSVRNNANGIADTSKSLAQKVRELPYRAIKVCHGSHGAILDLGCMPERIVTSSEFHENPADFLEETLTLAVDGATYAVATNAELGREATAAMIRVYSRHVVSRESELFRAAFLHTDKAAEPMPPGMISVASSEVQHQVSSITGAGAIFDSLFLSFLMRSSTPF